jgi:two-component system, sensor histidine kinase and response regulator
MTAHALSGDRERCLAGGMQGYISKPINRSELLELIDKMLRERQLAVPLASSSTSEIQAKQPAATNGSARGGETTVDIDSPIDIEASIMRAGDREFWQMLIDTYIEETHKRIDALRAVVAKGDADNVRREAHAIKGASAEVLASRVRSVAFELEQAGSSGSLSSAPVLLKVLEEEFARLESYLAEQRATTS